MAISKLTDDEAKAQYNEIIGALDELTTVYNKHLDKAVEAGLIASVFTLSRFYKNFIITAKELAVEGIIHPAMEEQLDNVLDTIDRNLATVERAKSAFGEEQ
jgi:hypothetical protein